MNKAVLARSMMVLAAGLWLVGCGGDEGGTDAGAGRGGSTGSAGRGGSGGGTAGRGGSAGGAAGSGGSTAGVRRKHRGHRWHIGGRGRRGG